MSNGEQEQLITRIVQAVISAQPPTSRSPTPPKVDIPKLTMKNYVDWSKKMRYALMLHQLWVDPSKDTATLTADETTINKKAVLFLACYLDDQNSALVNQSNDNCFISAWNAIKKFHRPRTVLTDIYSSIQALQHQPGQSIESHLIELEAQFSRFHEIEEKVAENHLVAMILTSVRNSSDFRQVFDSALWSDENSLTISKVKNVLISTQRQQSNRNNQQALKATFNQPKAPERSSSFRKRHNRHPKDPAKGFKCPDCEMDNHDTRSCTKRNRSSSLVRRLSNIRGNTANTDTQQTDQNVTVAHAYTGIKSRLGYASDDVLDIDYTMNDNDFVMSGNLNQNYSAKTTDISVLPHSQINLNGSDITTAPCGNRIKKTNLPKSFQPCNKLNSFPHVNQINSQNFLANSVNSLNLNKTVNSNQHSLWIIDSGAAIHMTKSRHLLNSFVPYTGHTITVANGNSIPIKGYGNFKIIIKNNNVSYPVTLNGVAFAPDLSVNLISVKVLTSSGTSIKFTDRSCYIENSTTRIPFGNLTNSSYILKIVHSNNDSLSNFQASSCIHEWHRKMSHRNIDHIQKIKKVLNLNIDPCKCPPECESCFKGKFHSLPFPKVSEKPMSPRDVITSDVCGPFRTESLGGARYFVTFTCANSDYTEIATIKCKSQVKTELISYINRCKTQFGNCPKTIRTDRGGEFMDNEIQTFLKQNGINFQCSSPRCPEQNGISERKNRTLVEAIRTQLLSKNLPKFLWAEALHHAVNTFNAIPKKSEFSSPKEVFFGKSFNFAFIEFGSSVYFLTDPTNRSKLAERGSPGIFVGHDFNSKGYRIFSNGKIFVARHVKFLVTPKSPNAHVQPQSDNATDPSIDECPPTPEVEPINELRRSERIRSRRSNTCTKTPFEPKTYRQAIACADQNKWILAMQEELSSIEQNNTWTLCELPKHHTAIGCRWVFKIKLDENGNAVKYKARLVAQGFTQKFGVDYDEVFALVTRSATFRTLLTVASARKLIVQQYDVKTAFLNGSLHEEIYMKMPPGSEKSDKVFKLNKSLYGLKQAARVWNQTLHRAMTQAGFTQSKHDDCLYIYNNHDDVCYVIIHVDDMIFASNSLPLIETITASLNESFELKCLGEVKHYLGIQITSDQEKNFSICQSQYITKIAAEFQLEDSKGSKYPLDPGYHKLDDNNLLENNTEYRKIIGMLLYVSTNTRPDISASVGILAQRVLKPRQVDMTEAKRVIKYLLHTKDIKLHMFDPNHSTTLTAFADSDWAEDRTTRRSISGVICKVFGGPVSWSSRKQGVVSTSTTEAEFYALSETIHEIKWLQYILNDFHVSANNPITVNSDNQSTIKLIENEKFSSRTKHIDVRLHAVRECVYEGKIAINYCPTEDNVADLLTKPLAGTRIQHLRKLAQLY